jgi:hypothetical protein
MTASAFYLYAVAAEGAPAPGGAGVLPGSALALNTAGGATALISAVPAASFVGPDAASADWVAARAAAHHTAVTSWHSLTPCLPLGFGTLFGSMASLGTWLEARAQAIAEGLARLAGREEWVLRLPSGQAEAAAWALAHDPDCVALAAASAAASPGRAVLLAKQAGRLAQARGAARVAEAADATAACLAAQGMDPVAETPPANAARAWRLLCQRAARPALPSGACLRLSGPFAPYGFARAALQGVA